MKNKNLIHTISNRYFVVNKLRNILVIIAVLLTSILFTSFFCVVCGIYKSNQQVDFRKSGYKAHAIINNINEEEFIKLKEQAQVKEMGYEAYVGDVTNKKLISRRSECWYMDQLAKDMRFAFVTNGHEPSAIDEVGADSESLRLLGIPLKVGAIIPLEIKVGDRVEKYNFRLSGWWESDVIDSTGTFIVSKKLYTRIKKENVKDKTGTALVMFHNPYHLEKKLNTLIQDSSYKRGKKAQDSMFSYVNSSYQSFDGLKNLSTLGMCIGFIILILVAGYLLIYNIFQISMSRDIQFFKLLQAIGLSLKQIRNIIYRQGIYICALGIPIGLYVGYLLGERLIPTLFFNMYTTLKGTRLVVKPNLWVFLFAILFSIITVMLSLRKSQKMLNITACNKKKRKCCKINIHKKQKKKQAYGTGIIHMALSNTTRNVKRTIITILSLSLCFVLVNTVYTMLKGMSFEAYVSGDLDSDFIVAHSDYFNLNYFMTSNAPSTKVIHMIQKQKGFTEGGKIYCDMNSFYIKDKNVREDELIYPANANENGAYMATLYGLETFPWNQLTVLDGSLENESLKDNAIFVGVEVDEQGNMMKEKKHFKVGDKITLEKMEWKEGEKKPTYSKYTYTVAGHIAENYFTNTNRSACNYNFYLQDSSYLKIADKGLVMSYKFNVKEENLWSMNQFLQNYMKNVEVDMNYESVLTYREAFEETFHFIQMVGIGLSGMVGVIGMINFVMTMIYNVRGRRQELAMLESIGLLKKQQLQMLIWEGTFYTLFTVIVSIAFSIISSIVLAKYFNSIISYYNYEFTLTPFLFIIPALELVSILVAIICSKMNDTSSLIERLKLER